MGSEFVDDVRIGESYWFVYDFEEDEASWYNMTPENTRSNVRNDILEKYNANSRIVYDYDGQSISIR